MGRGFKPAYTIAGSDKIKKMVFSVIFVVIFLVLYVFIEPFLIETREIQITDSNIPPEFNNTKIVFLTDIHHGPFFSQPRLKKIVDRVNHLSPDIVLLGGDYVHRRSEYITGCFESLQGLKAPYGVYGVLGNHDHRLDAEMTRESMEKAGIALIGNNATWIERDGQRIKVGGVGDFYEDTQDVNPTIGDAGAEDFVILVTHNPDYVEHLNTDKIDLVLAGHTHGGQVTFFGKWAPIIPSYYGQKYRTGIIQTNNTKVIVSNGIGTITPPVRFFARPQIIIVVLKKE